MSHEPDDFAPIFIGGAGRSGTTLLRVILDSHPAISCGPELKVLPLVADLWARFHGELFPTLSAHHLTQPRIAEIFATMVRSLLAEGRRASGKPRIAEKSPDNVFYFAHLACLFPESPLVHVVRDGRDVVSSLLRQDWFHPETKERDPRTTDVRTAAQYWVTAIRAGRLAAESSRHYVEVRYEDLVTSPEPTLRQLLFTIGEPFDASVLTHDRHAHELANESSRDQVRAPIHTRPIGAWRTRLTAEQQHVVLEVAGPTLETLGYDTASIA